MELLETQNKDLFSKLAFEVLGDIFNHCLPPETEPVSLKSGPLLLVQVCHRWREVAFGTPSLWQTVNMRRKWPENPIFILDLFLTKSGNLPLTITLPFNNARTPERNEAIVNRVLDDFHRVISLKGHTSPLFPYFIFKRLSAPSTPRHIDAPLLRHLDITGFDFPQEIAHNEGMNILHSCIIAPNLEELHLNSSRGMLFMVNIAPESLQLLTGLYVTDMAKIRDLSFLCETINLATLDFSVYDNYEDVVLKFPSSIYLPKLKHLNVSFFGAQFVEIIRSLHCPAIEKLGLHMRSDQPFPNLVEFLTKGQTPPLRYLHLSSCPGTQLSSFYRFRDVEELILHSFQLDEINLAKLLEKEDPLEFRLFPRLSSITIRKFDFDIVGQCDPILTVLRTRCITSGGTLTYAKFRNCRFQAGNEENVQALRKDLEGKLRIDIVTEGLDF